MKKVLLTLCSFIFSLNLIAQVTVYHDTVHKQWPKDGIIYSLKDSIINNTAAPITITWNKTSESILSGWDVVGVCDLTTCIPYGATMTNNFVLNPGQKSLLYIDAKAAVNATDGDNYLTISINDGVSNKPMTFHFFAWPSQVKETELNNVASIYPNPASNILYISILDEKVSNVNVINIIGNKIAKFAVTPNMPNPLRVPLDNVAKGVYMVQFMDQYGKVMTTKRITKQ